MVQVIATTSTTAMTTKATFLIFHQNGTYGLSFKHLRRKWIDLSMPSGTRLQRSFRGEAGSPRHLEILIAVAKFMEANWLQRKGTPDSQ